MQWRTPSSDGSGSRLQTRAALILTIATVLLVSGLWAVWYTPTQSYESRRNEQIATMTLVVESNSSASNDVVLKSGIKEITAAFWGQPVEADSNGDEIVSPVFTARVLDSDGKVLKLFNNVSSAGDGDKIIVDGVEKVKIVVHNEMAQSITVEVRVSDVSKMQYHPNEGFGQWLTVVSLPIFGLATWFVIAGKRQTRNRKE